MLLPAWHLTYGTRTDTVQYRYGYGIQQDTPGIRKKFSGYAQTTNPCLESKKKQAAIPSFSFSYFFSRWRKKKRRLGRRREGSTFHQRPVRTQRLPTAGDDTTKAGSSAPTPFLFSFPLSPFYLHLFLDVFVSRLMLM